MKLPKLPEIPIEREAWLTILATALAVGCTEFVRSGLYGSYLPQATGELLGLPRTQAVATAATAFTVHFIADTVSRGPAGYLVGRFGGRKVLLGGLLLMLLALGALPLVHSPVLLLLVAALHGVAFAVMWPGLANLTADAAKPNAQGRAITVVSLAVMPFVGVGFLTMGALAKTQTQWVIGLVLALQALAASAIALSPVYRRQQSTLPADDQPAPQQRTKAVARALVPLLPAAFMQTLSMTLLGPLLFNIYPDFGLSYWGMVSVLAVGGVAAFASFSQTGKYADHGHARQAVTLGYGLIAVGLALFALKPPLWGMYLLALLAGVGYAFVMPGWAALVTSSLPEKERPAAWGVLMTVENVGTSLGPLVGAFAFKAYGPTGPFLASGILAGITTLGYLIFRNHIAQASGPK